MLKLQTSFLLAEIFSLALGNFYSPESEGIVPKGDPILISEILDKFNGFVDHTNVLNKAKNSLTQTPQNEISLLTSQKTQESQMNSQTR
jgi:hypothetical protein